jgi:RNase H-like domain found in reverse transcriptase/Reverse transcriptase (RNA-dependent DNA polymerase)
VQRQQHPKTPPIPNLRATTLAPMPIAAGVGLSWRRECKHQNNMEALVNDESTSEKRDTTRINSNNSFALLANLQDTILGDTLDRANNRAAYLPPTLQGYRVPRPAPNRTNTQQELDIDGVTEITTPRKRRKGRRGRQRRNEPARNAPTFATLDDNQDTDDDIGDMQPEVELDADNSIFTRKTNPFKKERVNAILDSVKLGPDLAPAQRAQMEDLLREFADCFALSVSEVNAVPGAEHRIHIPPGTTFPKRVPKQRQFTAAQREFLGKTIDELLAADIIEPIRPEDVKCASPIALGHKTHDNPGLPLEELKHRVNEECTAHGLPPVHDLEPRPPPDPLPTTPPQPIKWRFCQNYNALNRVTEVFPMPQGDIRMKQRRLSGHRWVHGFDFASGFYAVVIPEEVRPYLAFYIEGRGFFTQKRMPFGLTGAPSTFAHVTAQALGDILTKLQLELFVDDGGMAGDDFEDMLERTRHFFQRVRETGLSLSAKKSKFFMTEMIFAGSKVGPDGVQPDEAKLSAVVDWRAPPDLLALSSFLGLTGFFRDLIRGYARLAQPLSDLLRSVNIPKNAGKSAYRSALRNVKLADRWTEKHQKCFLNLKGVLTSSPVLAAPHFDGTPFIVTSDGCKEGFGAVLSQRITVTRPGGKVITELHPIAYASKRTSAAEERYKPFMLEFAALKFALDKFDDIIWGFPVEVETDCQALRDVLLSTDLNATHARWRDGVLAHQIIDVRHIPGRVNLVGDALSRKDEELPRIPADGSEWSVTPDWEDSRGLVHDLFTVSEPSSDLHKTLRDRFQNENIFIEIIDALLGVPNDASERDRRRAAHRAKDFFIDEDRLWKLGSAIPARATPRRECVTKAEAIALARVEHEKTHMGRDLIKTQLLSKICSPFLDASITTAIRECGRCKNFGNPHIHALLRPIVRRRPFELLVGDYISMPMGNGGFTKIGLYADVFCRKLWAFKAKSATGKTTIDSLERICNAFIAPETFMVDGGSHFDCEAVRNYCASIGTKHHVVAAYSPWINGLIEGSNKILLNTLKRLCAPGLGEDEYDQMAVKDIPKTWPKHLDAAVKRLSDRILPSLQFSPNELLLGSVASSQTMEDPASIPLPSDEDIAIHMAHTEQLRLDGLACAVDHAVRRKATFDKKVLQKAPREVIFKPGQLVQVYRSDLTNVFASERKLTPFWSPPCRVLS